MEAACTLRYIFLDDRAGGYRCPVRLAREHRAAPSSRAAAAIGAYGQRTVRGPGDLVVWRPGPGLPASPADRDGAGTRPRARPARQAEGVGFEPTVTLPPQWSSRPVRTFQLVPSRSTSAARSSIALRSEVARSDASPASTQPRISAPTGTPDSAAIRSISANSSAGSRTDCTTDRPRRSPRTSSGNGSSRVASDSACAILTARLASITRPRGWPTCAPHRLSSPHRSPRLQNYYKILPKCRRALSGCPRRASTGPARRRAGGNDLGGGGGRIRPLTGARTRPGAAPRVRLTPFP